MVFVYGQMGEINPIFHSGFLVFIIPLILLLFERHLARLMSLQNIRSLSLEKQLLVLKNKLMDCEKS